MDQQLYVRIENKSLIPFFDPAREASRRLTLTTIKDNQRTAIVTIYRKDQAGAEIELKRYTVSPIPLAEAGGPKISLEAVKVSSRRVEIRLSLNRRSVTVDTLKLPSGGSRAWWLLLPLALLLLALLGVLVLPSRNAARPVAAGDTVTGKPAVRPAPEPRTSEPALTPAPAAESRGDEPAPAPRVSRTEPSSVRAPLSSEEPSAALSFEDGPNPEPKPAAEPEPPRLPPETLRKLVYFGPDNAELSPAAQAALREILPVLRRYPDARITVRGHCAPRGTEEGRRELSEERAAAVASFLRQAGIEIEQSRVSGLGAREPVSLLEKDEHLNRRVEIILEGA